MKGKPKFFIVQACRGDDVDFGLLSPFPTSGDYQMEVLWIFVFIAGIETDAKKISSPNKGKFRRQRTLSEIPKVVFLFKIVVAK